MVNNTPVTVLVVGAGARGTVYSQYALENPDEVNIIAVCEPRESYRIRLVEKHAIASENVYSDWPRPITGNP